MRSAAGMGRGVALGLLVPLSLMALSCGKKEPSATVNGKVSFNGKPLKGGSLAFFLSSDLSKGATTDIKEDGTYTVTNVPVGEIKVTVETESLRPPPAPPAVGKVMPKDIPEGSPYDKRMGPDPKNYIRIPDHYGAPDTTTLKYTVAEGTQTINIDLK